MHGVGFHGEIQCYMYMYMSFHRLFCFDAACSLLMTLQLLSTVDKGVEAIGMVEVGLGYVHDIQCVCPHSWGGAVRFLTDITTVNFSIIPTRVSPELFMHSILSCDKGCSFFFVQ